MADQSPPEDGAFASGLRLALTTLTVAPVRSSRVDRASAAVAMAVAPLVGASLGGVAAGAGWLLSKYGLGPLPTAAVLVALFAVLTRGLHLDGLADTADGLASYRDAKAALAIMKASDIGPMGVVAIVAVLVADTAALTTLLARDSWLAIVVAAACGRVAITICCSRGIRPARPDGLGALVAGVVPMAVALAWTGAALAASWPCTPRHWTGPVAVAVALGTTALLLRHVLRRLGGITGDVLGAGCEVSTAIALILLGAR